MFLIKIIYNQRVIINETILWVYFPKKEDIQIFIPSDYTISK